MLTAVKGKSYLTAPGCSDIMNPESEKVIFFGVETLEKCIKRVFDIDLFKKTRKTEVVYARHFYRYVLERLDKENKITDIKRTNKRNRYFKYTLYTIALMMECDHTSILASAKTTRNLMETNRTYRMQCERVLGKIKHGLIIFP